MALDKEYVHRGQKYTIDSVAGDVIPEDEFEYASIMKQLVEYANFDLGHFTINHKGSELMDKLVESSAPGGLTIYENPPSVLADVVLTDIIMTRPHKDITVTFTKA